MLENFRKLSQHWGGRLILALVLGFIVVSFVIWGMGDPFRASVATRLARVGSHDITVAGFRDRFEEKLNELSSRNHIAISIKDAHLYGIDHKVLDELMDEASLDAYADSLGLVISDTYLSAAIRNDPAFKGPTGDFDRFAFEGRLRQANVTEASYIAAQRAQLVRHEIGQALGSAIATPRALSAALARHDSEERAIAGFVLTPKHDETDAPQEGAGVDNAASGDAEKLANYYEEHKATWRAPEYRKLVVLSLSPEDIADAGKVSPEAIQKRYEANPDAYTKAETRHVLQVIIKDEDAANAAYNAIAGGQSFEDVAHSQGLSDKDIDLGMMAKSAFADKALGDAAFGLAKDAVSSPIKGQFGYALLKVVEIVPQSTTPLEAVKGKLAREIALSEAEETLKSLRERIEDERASGKSLSAIGDEIGHPAITLEAVDAGGYGKPDASGKAQPLSVPNRQELLKAAFASGVGVDNDVLSMAPAGYQWFDVISVESAHDRAMAEVLPAVKAAYKSDEETKALAESAAKLIVRLNKGENIDALARENTATLLTFTGLKRGDVQKLPAEGKLGGQAITQVFATPLMGAGSTPYGGGRLVFVITASENAAPDYASDAMKTLASRLSDALADDIMLQFIARLETRYGTFVDEAAYARATGAQDLE